ncbi:MAG TPA: SiaC family regulatory phosphoprotein [Bacteroidales bacterium]|nr:SiaC family regulatory phosphoprotein [Bacteroidales bacterium]HPV26080.1 SiaC family regulatory phosphoprotein [Bacteroidales bacterium]
MMEKLTDLIIEKTPKTPQIELKYNSGELSMTGRSLPENASRIYEPVLNWVNNYVIQPQPVTNLRLNVEYFNTSSLLWISKIVRTLTRINNPDYRFIVHIYIPLEEYDDMQLSSDVRESFNPITDILQDSIPEVSLKLYATDDTSKVIRDALVLF